MAQKKKKIAPASSALGQAATTTVEEQTYHPSVFSDRRLLWIAVGLVLAVGLLFARTYHFDFIDYDDPYIILNNKYVTSGLTWEGVKWAFTSTDYFYWQPLTWLSHMLDCQLFGVKPGPPHIENAILHALNSLLVLGLLFYVTGRLWRSAFVAAIFAIHPLRVESVAWVGERKDVLSGFFFLLTLCLWVWYTRKPGDGKRYALVLGAFLLALMSKPVVVTLPVLLLFFDYWPLQRWSNWRGAAALVREKLPLFFLSIAVSLTTLLGNAQEGSLVSTSILPLGLRIANAIVSYAMYIAKFFWPDNLGILYPYLVPGLFDLSVSAAILIFITGAALLYARKLPYLLAGWLFFAVGLLPTSGLLQTGSQAMADRFTYLPLLGLACALTWGIADFLANRTAARILWPAAALAIVAMGVATWVQIGYWTDAVSIYRHTLQVTDDNLRIYHNLGALLYRLGQVGEAEKCYREAIRISPDRVEDRIVLAQLLREQRKYDDAVTEFQKALRMDETIPQAWKGLGLTFIGQKKTLEAMGALQRAVKLAPEDREAKGLLDGLMTFHGDVKPPEVVNVNDKGSNLKDTKAPPPPSQQAVFSEQQAVELGAVLGLLALTFVLRPRWGGEQFRRFESKLREWSLHPRRMMLILFAVPLLLRLVILPLMPAPVPIIADEFGYLLVADHLAHGELTAPVHPMHDFFESIYILQKTSYTSVYPIAQGILLAIPKILGLNPWIAVWLSVGVMCAALYWMLLGWLPSHWALFGAGIAMLRYSIISHWMNSYWGGSMAAIGGALLLGSLGRLRRKQRPLYALLFGLGFAIDFQSRPYETAFLMTASCIVLVIWFWQSKQRLLWIRNVAAPLAAVVILTAAFSGYYNYRVTGNPLLFPYQQYQTQHGAPQAFYWQKPIPKPPGLEKYKEISDMYDWQLEQYSVRYSWTKLLQAAGDKARLFWGFFLQPVWTLPLLLLPFAWRDRRVRILYPIALAVFAGVSLYPFFFPHYIAPITGILLVVMVQCLRRMRVWSWQGRPLGAFLALGVVVITIFGVLTPAGGTLWGQGRSPRSQIEDGMEQRGGQHLVLVHYRPEHVFHYTYVYNAAHIDAAPIVWARDLGPEKNQEILNYYRGRQAWMFLPDARPPRLEPYDPKKPLEVPLPNSASSESLPASTVGH